MQILENNDITNNSTMRIKTTARYYCEVESVEQLKEAIQFAKDKNIKFAFLGDGSNTIFAGEFLDILIIKNNITKIDMETTLNCDCDDCIKIINENRYTDTLTDSKEGSDNFYVKVSSGMNWDSFVRMMARKKRFGVESLAYIPGTVGGAIVQNAGAYGSEIKDMLIGVEALNTDTLEIEIFKNEKCKFEYRNSFFKNNPKYIILSGTFELNINPFKYKTQNYTKEVKEYVDYLENKNYIVYPLDVYTIVKMIRQEKLPEFKDVNNVGSFFKNPIISKQDFENLQNKIKGTKFEDQILSWEVKGKRGRVENMKIGAGRILDLLGYKNFNENFVNGNFGTYKNTALTLVHCGKGDYNELREFVDIIKKKVREEFMLEIEEEPVFIGQN